MSESSSIASCTERLEFWTAVMRDNLEPTTMRLRASENLAKFLDTPDDRHHGAGTSDPALLTEQELLELLET